MHNNSDTTAKIINLSQLIAYQNGAVVSRAIIKQQTGSVTLFAFDKAEELSEHTAPFDALVQIIDGCAQISVAGEQFILNKDQSIIMPANKPHSLKALERFKMLLVMIKE